MRHAEELNPIARSSMEFEESDYQNGIDTVRDAHDDILDNSLNNEMRTNTD